MLKIPDRLNGFLFFSLAFLLVLALLPGTGWIVRMPLWLRLPGVQQNTHAWENEVEGPWERPGPAVKPDPGDYLLALGQAQAIPDDFTESPAVRAATEVHALQSVERRFPGHPSMPAHEIPGWLYLDSLGMRKEGGLLYGMKLPSDFRGRPADPVTVDGVLQAAVRGEQRDPENAFYPLMRWASRRRAAYPACPDARGRSHAGEFLAFLRQLCRHRCGPHSISPTGRSRAGSGERQRVGNSEAACHSVLHLPGFVRPHGRSEMGRNSDGCSTAGQRYQRKALRYL